MKKPPGKGRKTSGASPPMARLPLPLKSEKRHGDRKKYDRKRDKVRLRKRLMIDD
jgi:hypothetical protein